jgi:hypothetical protein
MAAEQRKSGWMDAVPRDIRLPLLLSVGVLAVVLLLAQGLVIVLLVLVACGLLVLLERTVGDWLADVLGAAGRSIIVALVLLVVGWQLLSSPSRRAATLSFLGLEAYWVIDTMPASAIDIPPSSAPPPAQTSSASPPRTGTGGPPSSASSPSRPANVPAASAEPGSPSSRVRMNVVSRSESTGVRLEARLSGADKIDGIVDFIVDGKRVATASVAPDGRAVAYLRDVGPGTYQVEARFRGGGDLGETSSRITLRRN